MITLGNGLERKKSLWGYLRVLQGQLIIEQRPINGKSAVTLEYLIPLECVNCVSAQDYLGDIAR